MSRSGAARLVILHAGFCGENVLVRLLSATGRVRVVGQVLARPVKQPHRLIRQRISDRHVVQAALVQPHHLWLVNSVDPWDFLADLVTDGVTVVSLHRASGTDRGVSRALCGPDREVLPAAPQVVDAADVVVFGRENDFAAEWFSEVVPTEDLQLRFEQDLGTPQGRDATVTKVASALGLEAWPAPPEREAPTTDLVWSRVADAAALRAQLTALQGPGDG